MKNRRSTKGFSMVELVISVAILAVFILIWATTYVQSKQLYERATKDLELNKDAYLMNYALQINISQGYDVRAGSVGDLVANTCCEKYGLIAEYDSNDEFDTAVSKSRPLMMFLRDARLDGSTSGSSLVRSPTALVVKTPTASEFGSIYLFNSADPGSEASPTLTLDPKLASFHIDNVVRVRIYGSGKVDAPDLVDGALNNHPPISAAMIEYTVRKKSENTNNPLMFCPKEIITSACAGSANFSDRTYVQLVSFRNNAVGESISTSFKEYISNGSLIRQVAVVPKVRLLGSAHFYQLKKGE